MLNNPESDRSMANTPPSPKSSKLVQTPLSIPENELFNLRQESGDLHRKQGGEGID